MATLTNSNWLSTILHGPKPKIRATTGIKEFSEAAYKASNGAPPRLIAVYRSYKEPAKKRA